MSSYTMCIFTHFFFIPRYIALLAILFWALLTTFVISIGANIDDLSETRRWLILQNTCLCMRVFIRIFGVSSCSTRRPEVDYKKWLGPDWKPTYEGASMIVSNHQTWTDIFNSFLFVRPMPGFIAKSGVK